MFHLKPITREAVPRALEKAERYRLLNEPREAESICRDILEVDPENQKALVTLVLALSDRFHKGGSVHPAQEILPRIQDEYQRTYYSGIICERRGKALLDHGAPGSGYVAYDWFRDAMELYEKAETIRPAGNDDAILRWNTCARAIMQHHLQPGPQERSEYQLE